MTSPKPDPRRRSYWLKTLHEWHWVSSALCLIGMLLFAVTGFTLNHAGQIESRPRIVRGEAALPDALRVQLVQQQASQPRDRAPVPAPFADWVRGQWGLEAEGREAEWTADELYVSLPRPGGDAWVRVALADGEAEYERTDRGWIAYLNDLHKGRNTGLAWSWFLDIFAVACLVFSLTGLVLLKMHAGNRSATWPMVGLGLVIPLVLALLFIH